MSKVKCYYLTALDDREYSRPVYYKVIGTFSEMDDFCSELWTLGDDAEIDREREASEEELAKYSIREDKGYPLVYESIRPFD